MLLEKRGAELVGKNRETVVYRGPHSVAAHICSCQVRDGRFQVRVTEPRLQRTGRDTGFVMDSGERFPELVQLPIVTNGMFLTGKPFFVQTVTAIQTRAES